MMKSGVQFQLGQQVRVKPQGVWVGVVPGTVEIVGIVSRQFVEQVDDIWLEEFDGIEEFYNIDGEWVAYRYVEAEFDAPDETEGIFYMPVDAFEEIVERGDG